MSYHIDSDAISIDELQAHVAGIDLVPSRQLLKDDIGKKFENIKENGVLNLNQLRQEIKTSGRIKRFAEKTQLDFDYLNLLRREIESWYPKPRKLTEFTWMPESEITRLVGHNYINTKNLCEAIASSIDLA